MSLDTEAAAENLKTRRGSTLSEIAVAVTKNTKKRHSIFVHNTPTTLSDEPLSKLASNKASALAARYRLSDAPRKTSHVKIMRVKRLNALHADGAFDVEDKEEEEKERKKSMKDVKAVFLDDFDDLVFEDEEEQYEPIDTEDVNQKLYKEACKEYKVRSLKLIHSNLIKESLTLVSIVLREKEAKALATALVKNSCIETLRLDNNNLGGTGSSYIADVLTRNMYLTDIKIVENQMGSQGAESICNALRNNNHVRRLDLSGNGFIEDDASFFKEMLDENHALRELYLSHNEFRERGGEIFADGLATNDFLRVLDLSWNHLRMGGATAIGKALQVNHHLEKLDISWNGFHVRGAITISKALEVNNTLIDLNINCNRLTDPCVTCLLKGLEHNTTLKVLRMASNPITPVSAQNILECIDTHPALVLELVDLGEQCVSDKFDTLFRQIKQKRELKFIYGLVWKTDRNVLGHDDDDEDEDALLDEDPIMVLMEFARLQNLSLLDMFLSLDKDNSGALSRQEFIDGLEEAQIPMRTKALNKLIDKMDQDGDGEVDFGELKEAQRIHKDKLKDYLKGTIPIEQTEIGRIDKHLRVIINKRLLRRKPEKSEIEIKI